MIVISHNDSDATGGLGKKLGQKGPQMIKIKEKIEIIDITSVSLQKSSQSDASGGGNKCLQVMLRSTSNRMRQYVLPTDE